MKRKQLTFDTYEEFGLYVYRSAYPIYIVLLCKRLTYLKTLTKFLSIRLIRMKEPAVH